MASLTWKVGEFWKVRKDAGVMDPGSDRWLPIFFENLTIHADKGVNGLPMDAGVMGV